MNYFFLSVWIMCGIIGTILFMQDVRSAQKYLDRIDLLFTVVTTGLGIITLLGVLLLRFLNSDKKYFMKK